MSVRVVAGSLKGRALATPAGLSTRPTAGRAREAMFSILGDVSGLSVLDLYAGSGALGIEALSRGAARAVFVENDRKAAACLLDNIERLDLGGRARLLSGRAESASRVLEAERFELVFCDPPWAALDAAIEVLAGLVVRFAETARVVLEHPATRVPAVRGLVAVDARRWGDTGATFFERAVADPAADD
jgi:16S rRNA (guanine966-N2)-methyltransferase